MFSSSWTNSTYLAPTVICLKTRFDEQIHEFREIGLKYIQKQMVGGGGWVWMQWNVCYLITVDTSMNYMYSVTFKWYTSLHSRLDFIPGRSPFHTESMFLGFVHQILPQLQYTTAWPRLDNEIRQQNDYFHTVNNFQWNIF